jgi:leucyl-tRNA synthetase
MAVPAHDTRDFAFAKKYNLEIIQSIAVNNKIPDLEKPRE